MVPKADTTNQLPIFILSHSAEGSLYLQISHENQWEFLMIFITPPSQGQKNSE